MTEISTQMEEEDLSQNNDQRNMTYIHLVVFEKGVKTFYYDKCEVVLRRHKIYVTPDDEDANKLWRTIDNNFVKHNYIICFFSSINGFALIFDHKKDCRRVYNELMKRQVGTYTSHLSDTTLERRFIIPMIKELYDYSELDFEFVFFILKFLRSLDIEQKQRLAPMIIETGIEQELLDRILIGVDLSAKEQEANTSKKPNLVDTEDKTDKQRQSGLEKSSTSKQPMLLNQDDSGEVGTEGSSSVNQLPKFATSLPKIVRFGVNKTEYFDDKNEEGSPTPIKKPRPSNSSSFPSSIVNPDPITTPFQTIDYTQSGTRKTHLFIFTDETQKFCHEYYWELRSSKFRCCEQKCRKRGPIVKEDADGIEQVYFAYDRCQCPPRLFESDRYKDDIIVVKPNYLIRDELSHGKVKPKLYVYASEDKKKSYKFDYDEKGKRYLCIKCRNSRHLVRAITCLNEDEEEFVSIQNKEHKCEPIDC